MGKEISNAQTRVIPALDALIGSPEMLTPQKTSQKIGDVLVIPSLVYLTKLKQFSEQMSNTGDAAKILLSSIARMLSVSGEEYCYVAENGMRIVFVRDEYPGVSISESTVMVAKKEMEKYPNDNVTIYTGDNSMFALAKLKGVAPTRIKLEPYTGRRKLALPHEAYSQWFSKGYLTEFQFGKYFPEEKPLLSNEFVEFEIDTTIYTGKLTFSNTIGRFVMRQRGESKPCLQQLRYVDSIKGITPRNAGQAMLLDALMDPDITAVAVDSIAGSGKTFLGAAAACAQVSNMTLEHERKDHSSDSQRRRNTEIATPYTAPANTNNRKGGRKSSKSNNHKERNGSSERDCYSLTTIDRYDSVVVIPSHSQLGKEIGYYPGTERQKMAPLTMPIRDNLIAVLACRQDLKPGGQKKTRAELESDADRLLERNFEIVPLIRANGRSFTRKLMMLDEAQHHERYQIIQLITRCGEGSKVFISGDSGQIYNPHMNEYSNGLAYMTTILRGQEWACVVKMTKEEIVRSDMVKHLSELIS